MFANRRFSSPLARCEMPLRNSLCAAAVFAAALLLGLAPPASAVWPVNPGTNLPVCTAATAQLAPMGIAPDGSGGVYVAWNDSRNGDYDIYAQHLLGVGYADPAWPVNGLAVAARYYNQTNPAMTIDALGGVFVVWADNRVPASVDELYIHHLRSTGTLDPSWPAGGRMLSAGSGTQARWTCIPDGAGGAVIAWDESRGASGYDIYLQRVSPAGAISWGASGLLASGATGSQNQPVVAADMVGGAVVAWEDYRKAVGGDTDIYAARVLANGTLDPAWAAGGVAVCSAIGGQAAVGIFSDGAGGAFVAWQDYRSGAALEIYATHVRSNGTLDPAWPANGRLVHGAATNVTPAVLSDGGAGALVVSRDSLVVVNHLLANGTLDPAWPAGGVHLPGLLTGAQSLPDGAGGVLVVYEDYTTAGAGGIGAHRVRSTGVLDPAWPAGGRLLSTTPNAAKSKPVAATDGAGGAIAAWVDARNMATTNYDVYAQRVRSTGVLGIPEPHIVSAQDVRGDQGGKLLLAWSASEGDAMPNPYVSRYHLWRQVSAGVVVTRATAAAAARAPGESPRPGDVRASAGASGSTWWEFIATVPASQMPAYAYTVPTTTDSLPGWIPWDVFVVDAEDNAAWAFYSSHADSGYSADNLAPHFPAPAFGRYTQGITVLHWPPSPEPDFGVYRLYRSTNRNFTPGPENFVVAKPDTGYLDYPGQPSYYIIQSVDVHGNASPNALIEPIGILDAGGLAIPKTLAFRGAQPNPARGLAAFAFDLPAAADVRITVFDVNGRRVRELEWNGLPAGSHRLAWDGRDSGGATAAAGLYLARLEALGAAKRSRFVLTR